MKIAMLVATALLAASTAARAQVPVQVLHNFSGYNFSQGPSAALVEATDGNLYGTTTMGGLFNRGTIFRRTPSGSVTILHSFAGGNGDGAIPEAALLQGADGKLYGTTSSGGAHGSGTIFRMGLQGGVEILHSFSQRVEDSVAGLIQAEDGNFYGTTATGGASNGGTAFRMSPNGSVVVLHNFAGGPSDGESPHSALIQASDGHFYGTTSGGGALPWCSDPPCGRGTVFRMTVDGAVTILHSFAGGLSDGAGPQGPVIQASDGNLYGTAISGGDTYCGTCGDGIVFRMSLGGAYTVLHVFHRTVDGSNPSGSLLEANDGGLYGTFESGPSATGGVYRISTAGAFTLLHTFSGGREGHAPRGGLIQASDGTFYGSTLHGGLSGFGTLYRITAGGALTTLNEFTGSTEGYGPSSGLLRASDGNFYGTTYSGGRLNKGTIFRVTPAGSHSLVYTFTGRLDGRNPSGGLVQGRDGNLYGTTPSGGAYDSGVVFQVTLAGKFKTMHALTGNAEGASPNGVIQAIDGNFYGTTQRSRTGLNFGTIFRMMPDGRFEVLRTFKVVRDGAHPAGLLQASDGNFYGMTSEGGHTFPDAGDGAGTIFRLTPGGAFTVLHRFDLGAEGRSPNTNLVQASDGNLYGTTSCGYPIADGGPTPGGAFFRLTLSGVLRVLARNGVECDNEFVFTTFLTPGPDGLYGTTSGTVFEMTYAGSRTTLCNAATCRAFFPVTVGSNGNLYGVGFGGADRAGQVLRLTPLAVPPARVTVSTRRDAGVRLTWQTSGNATSYRVKRLTGGSEVLIASNLRGTSFTDTSAVPGKTYHYVVTAVNQLGESLNSYQVSITAGRATLGDFEGDGRTDLAVYRPSNGYWFARFSSDNFSYASSAAYQWGLPGDVPVSGDFDGDGRMDLTVFRPSDGVWYVRFSSSDSWTPYQWGLPGDVPLGADMDGDGRTDLVVFRPSTAVWYVRFSSDDYSMSTWQALQWGLHGDVPMAGDVDGDGKSDLVVFRPAEATWYVRFSSDSYPWSTWQAFQWGEPGDVPVAGDFDGDGKTDLAVFTPDTGYWRLRYSANILPFDASETYQWGLPGDVPVAVDADGDGRTELTVFRPSTGEWFTRYSSSEYSYDTWTVYQWGLPGDTPLP